MSVPSSDELILLTGASGFLGTEIVRQCNELALPLRCVSRTVVRGVEDACRFDLVKEEIPDGLFDGVSVVIHAAGLAHQFGDVASGAFESVNAFATERVVQAAADSGVAHVVLVSSSGVYGRSDVPQDETATCSPVGEYACSKLEGEKRAISIAKQAGMRLTILRMTTLYGAGDRGNMNRLMRAIDRGKFIRIGSGENQKSFIHKTDAARACLLTATKAGEFPNGRRPAIQIFNVAVSPERMSDVVNGLVQNLHGRNLLFVPSGLVTSAIRLLKTVCFGRGPFARIHKGIEKYLSDDVFDGTRFSDAYEFNQHVSLTHGLADQVAHYRMSTPPRARHQVAKRLFDVILSSVLIILFAVPMLIIALLVRVTSKGPALYWSNRMGRAGKTFSMAKFRSMRTDTPEVATHLLADSKSFITPVGRVLRKTSLDELPQLFNVLRGHMSFVGPRPSLPSQTEVNELRDVMGVSQLKPGITGWAAVNGRDELVCSEKVLFDFQYLKRNSIGFDIQIILQTVLAVARRDGIKQADDCSETSNILFNDGNQIALLATPDTLIAASLARKFIEGGIADGALDVDCRLVSIRLSNELSSAQIRSAVGGATKIIFVSREDDEFVCADQIEDSMMGSETVTQIALPVSNQKQARSQQIYLDMQLMVDEMQGNLPARRQKLAIS